MRSLQAFFGEVFYYTFAYTYMVVFDIKKRFLLSFEVFIS